MLTTSVIVRSFLARDLYKTRHPVCDTPTLDTCCVVQNQTQQHQASWQEVSVFALRQAGKVSGLDFLTYNLFVSGFL